MASERLATVAELNARLDAAWNGTGDYADDDIDILRALAGEALMMGRDFAALLSEREPGREPTPQQTLTEVRYVAEDVRGALLRVEGALEGLRCIEESLGSLPKARPTVADTGRERERERLDPQEVATALRSEAENPKLDAMTRELLEDAAALLSEREPDAVQVTQPVLAWAAVCRDDGTIAALSVGREGLPDGPGVFHEPLGSVRASPPEAPETGRDFAGRQNRPERESGPVPVEGLPISVMQGRVGHAEDCPMAYMYGHCTCGFTKQ